MKITDALAEGKDLLREAAVIEAAREAASLLAYALKCDRSFLIAHPEYKLTPAEKTNFELYIKRRSNHEPFQYIVGKQEFFGLDFEVTPDVLIPRPETEILVEAALKHLRSKPNPHFCEIGVGSGCISVALLHELKEAIAIAGDISEAALAIAKRNAARHKVDDRLELIISDVFENIPERSFDAIVSNPPYVPSDDFESLQAEVRDFEPPASLSDGFDGLSIINRIIEGASSRLLESGHLFIEIGFNQSGAVEQMFGQEIWSSVELLPDLQGIPRIVVAKIGT